MGGSMASYGLIRSRVSGRGLTSLHQISMRALSEELHARTACSSLSEQLLDLRRGLKSLIGGVVCELEPRGENRKASSTHDNIHHNSTSHSFIFRCRFVLPQELHLGRNSVGIDGARQLAAGLAAR